MEKNEEIVVDSQTSDVMGRDTRFTRYSNIIESLWIRFFGYGMTTCSGPLSQPEKEKRQGQIYTYVLVPKQAVQPESN